MKKAKPRISILSREFKYVNAARTDIGATFRRVRRELREANEVEQRTKVLPIRRTKP